MSKLGELLCNDTFFIATMVFIMGIHIGMWLSA